jgi:Mn-dependent DtxR family transcriptional regulator
MEKRKGAAMKKITNSKGHYLKAIFRISQENGAARVTDIASDIGVTKVSASCAVKELEKLGLVLKAADHRIYLTNLGLNIVLPLINKYELIKQFFMDAIGINEEDASIQACALEHVISNEGVEAIAQFCLA